MTKWVDISHKSEILENEPKIKLIDGTAVAVFNLSGEFYAIEDRCTHQHLPLADGLIDNENIICPFHGAVFSIKTGELKAPPACENLTTFPTRLMNDMVQIQMEA